ncbi:putative reverse transcriptase domain-containing protein, partial [Tanacetum coccineum]
VEQGTDAMEKLVERLGNTEDNVECNKLKNELEEERGFVFEERPNEAINVPIENEKSPSSESRGSPHDSIMPPKSAPMTQAAICRMIKENVDAAIADEQARQANVRNDASGSGPVREGKKVKFVVATLEGPALTWWKTKVATMGLEIVMKYDVVAYTQSFNELALMCPRMVEPERVKVDAYIRGLSDNTKGEVTSSKPADLNEAVRMAHKLMEQKSQTRDARILEGKKRKWESLQSGNGSGQCMIKRHKCGKVGHKARYCKDKSVATGANTQPVWTCYDCSEEGHTRNRCPKKIKQEEVREVRGRAYAIKDVEP